MFLMDCGALGAFALRAPERGAERHPNRNSDPQPDRNVSGQNTGDRTQGRSQRNAQSRMFRFVSHLLAPERCYKKKK
jgi:hypothetical protein